MRLKTVLPFISLSAVAFVSIGKEVTPFDLHSLNIGQIVDEAELQGEVALAEESVTRYISGFDQAAKASALKKAMPDKAAGNQVMNTAAINLPPDNLSCYNLGNNLTYTINLPASSYVCADFNHTDSDKGFSIDGFESTSGNLKVSAYLYTANGYVALGSANSGSNKAAFLRTTTNFAAGTIRVVTHYDPLNTTGEQYKLSFRTFGLDSHEPNNSTAQASSDTDNHFTPAQTSYQVAASLSHESDVDVFMYDVDSNDKTRFVTLRVSNNHIDKFGVAVFLNDDATQLQTSYEFNSNLWNEPGYAGITFKVSLAGESLSDSDKLIVKVIPLGTGMFTDVPYHINVSGVDGSQVSSLTGSYEAASGGLIYFRLNATNGLAGSQLVKIEYNYPNNGSISAYRVSDSQGRVFYDTPVDSCSFIKSISNLKISVYLSDIDFWYAPVTNGSFPHAICQ
ncbi:hypothetical protein SG34_009945 [Thalassomonas viridans]|uniref:Uncharacterized protein n=1 Tax=Thalassomonas viridans TaxID=137584 RepID=A0AAE9Z8D4_9GAMM|nr:hypothetical protein [Thalassomonas viridans]WDE07178.1 hypothetical protein SG34_009945 [Thalassomonas viridans]